MKAFLFALAVMGHGDERPAKPETVFFDDLALGGVYPASVNKVKSPYPGIPESTVELIKAGKARVLVDWVRIIKG